MFLQQQLSIDRWPHVTSNKIRNVWSCFFGTKTSVLAKLSELSSHVITSISSVGHVEALLSNHSEGFSAS